MASEAMQHRRWRTNDGGMGRFACACEPMRWARAQHEVRPLRRFCPCASDEPLNNELQINRQNKSAQCVTIPYKNARTCHFRGVVWKPPVERVLLDACCERKRITVVLHHRFAISTFTETERRLCNGCDETISTVSLGLIVRESALQRDSSRGARWWKK